MHAKTNTASPHVRRSPLRRLIDWIADREAEYRAARKLREMPDERLQDMGMTREDAETAFRNHRPRRARSAASLAQGRVPTGPVPSFRH